MANESTQLNTRIDARVKREGDAVFARFGLTPSLVVRAVWNYAIDHQRPPEFMLSSQDEDGKSARIAALREGAGLACVGGGGLRALRPLMLARSRTMSRMECAQRG